MSTLCVFPYTMSNMETLANTLHTRTQLNTSVCSTSVSTVSPDLVTTSGSYRWLACQNTSDSLS